MHVCIHEIIIPICLIEFKFRLHTLATSSPMYVRILVYMYVQLRMYDLSMNVCADEMKVTKFGTKFKGPRATLASASECSMVATQGGSLFIWGCYGKSTPQRVVSDAGHTGTKDRGWKKVRTTATSRITRSYPKRSILTSSTTCSTTNGNGSSTNGSIGRGIGRDTSVRK
eukprot:GHVU01188920.1.p1 GENE.GHVU01188920.1~~GHVU01188920.1.p1  ORF type:complete len:170 (+),score=9.17 GHVU01188920.1:1020-1529(+)